MKVLKRHLEKDGAGYIQLRAEESEDMWHAYNLIETGDSVRTTTVRKVSALHTYYCDSKALLVILLLLCHTQASYSQHWVLSLCIEGASQSLPASCALLLHAGRERELNRLHHQQARAPEPDYHSG